MTLPIHKLFQFCIYRKIFEFYLCSVLMYSHSAINAQTFLPASHAHNDYNKCRKPLINALELGFQSIEVDVFYYNSHLKIAHVPFLLGCRPDLEKLYFEPLLHYLESKETNTCITLMIDIKNKKDLVYSKLKDLVQKYEHLLSYYDKRNDLMVKRKVKLLISGQKPYEKILNDTVTYLFLDGNPGDENRIDPNLMPRISRSFRSYFRTKNKKDSKVWAEIAKKTEVLKEKNISFRFWAVPNNKKIWEKLLESGVSWINVDQLKKYQSFCISNSTQ